MRTRYIFIIHLFFLIATGFSSIAASLITLAIYLIFRKKPWESDYKLSKSTKSEILNKLEKISPNFKKYQKNLLKSVKPFIKITHSTNNKLELWNSKFGGNPYLPKNYPYPKNSKGNYLYLAAQINFAEIPQLEKFPTQGILEFFVSVNNFKDIDGTFGVENTSQKNIRIIYFPKIIQNNDDLISDFSFLQKPNDKNFPDYRYASPIPVANESCLTFEKKYSPISTCDISFEKVVGKDGFDFFERKLDGVNYVDLFDENSSKIGGYPAFEQYDPRDCVSYGNPVYERSQYSVLLLMMGSKTLQGIGTLNFFIKEKDLINKDFSNVLASFDAD